MADENVPQVAPCACDAAPVAAAPAGDDTYGKFLGELSARWEKFVAEAKDGATNKAAALRARKLSLDLRKDLQGFREVSIANDKKPVAK